MSADDLTRFGDGEFGAVVALHLVEHLQTRRTRYAR